ncbi:manganese efflux pump [Sphingomonas parva]|uniref:Putative manganese efflux pump MntP n=2 Tax=Sphingomonas parva TaxID=2555898 RepID=A0A4Y8ZNB3_9SPHN|nr:manganese efflux pump [Sphingomonas parva]
MLFALAGALAADAFAVALCQGAASRPGVRDAVRIGTAFGLAQAVMPLLGWAAGIAFASVIRDVDHWIAFGLLALLGLKTLHEGLRGGEEADCTRLSGWALLGASVATSIDAAAAGVTLPSLGAHVVLACAVIGAVTLALCAAGVFLGAAGGQRLGKRAEILGGLALLVIGTKVLVQHVYFGG